MGDEVCVELGTHLFAGRVETRVRRPRPLIGVRLRDGLQPPVVAYYREFVQWERLKPYRRFGANRTVDSMMSNGVGASDAV